MKTRIWAALLAVYIVWGSTYLAIRFAVESMPPFLMAATRFLIAGTILYAGARLSGTAKPERRHWRPTVIMGLFLLLGGNGLVAWAEQHVVSSVTALMIGATPLWIVLVDALRPGGRRPALRTMLGVLIGLAGIILLVGPSSLFGEGESIDLWGALALVAAALFWAIGSVFGREKQNELPEAPLLATSMEMLAGGAGLLVFGSLMGEWSLLDVSAITPRSLLGLAYLIVFGSLVGFAAYTWLLRVAPTPLVSTYAYVNPLVAVFLGSVFAQEPLTLRILLAAAVILSSVVLINTSRFSSPQPKAILAEARCSEGVD